MAALQSWGETKYKKIKFKMYSFISLCLKVAVFRKTANYTAEICNSTSLLLPSLASNLALSTNLPAFPSSALHLCPLTHIFASLLPSTPSFCPAATIPGFEHQELQPQTCQCPSSATPLHAPTGRTSAGERPLALPPAEPGVVVGREGALGCPHSVVALVGAAGVGTAPWTENGQALHCVSTTDCCQKEEWEGWTAHRPCPLQ